MGDQQYGIDIGTVDRIAADVKASIAAGSQICMVIGGGNIFRGLSGAARGIERATADLVASDFALGALGEDQLAELSTLLRPVRRDAGDFD